jgi:hypothetical protein
MNLKHDLTKHYLEHEADYGKEETFNTLQILASYNDNLDKLYPYDSMLLLRLIDDESLAKRVEEITIPVNKEYNPFD